MEVPLNDDPIVTYTRTDDLPDLDSEVYRSDEDQHALDWCEDCTQAGGHRFVAFEENTFRCIHCGIEG